MSTNECTSLWLGLSLQLWPRLAPPAVDVGTNECAGDDWCYAIGKRNPVTKAQTPTNFISGQFLVSYMVYQQMCEAALGNGL